MKKNNPKILIIDLETAPNLAHVWGKYEQDVLSYVREWYILCFAYKWLYGASTHVNSLPQYPLYKKEPENDRELVKDLWKLFEEADVIIAHNGNSFDIKKSNARFIYHNLPQPKPYKSIDTKLVAKRSFNFNSNKLDDLGKYFGIGRKLQTGGFDLWLGCMKGDKKAWKKMTDYNKYDVILLEKVYLKMRGWDKAHPNLNLISDTIHNCPNCGSGDVQKRGFNMSKVGKKQSYRCNDCGAYSSGETIKNKGIILR